MPKQSLTELPPPQAFSITRAEYLVVEDETRAAPTEEELRALDALHLYYDAFKERLASDCAQRQAAYAARVQWLKDYPPVAKPVVINFWMQTPVRQQNSSSKEAAR